MGPLEGGMGDCRLVQGTSIMSREWEGAEG